MRGRPYSAPTRHRIGPDPDTSSSDGRSRLRAVVQAIAHDDEAAVEAAITRIARAHRVLAPLVFVLGALMMLLQGLRLLISNWRLLLVQVLPAMWIWAGMLNLRLHLFRGRTFTNWHGVPALLLMAGIVAATTASYFLNLVFAFAVASPPPPRLRPAFSQAGRHWAQVGVLGLVVGGAYAVAAVISPRWGRGWFSLSVSVVLAVMMVTYVAFPARLLGVTSNASRRDKLAATAVSAAVGAAISTPAYMTGRLGILLLGSRLFVIGVILACVGFSLQAGASGAITAIKMSVKLVVGKDGASTAP